MTPLPSEHFKCESVVTRWFCPHCGIVRDRDGEYAPFCRHYAMDLPATRMTSIRAGHPLATGPLPFTIDGTRS